MSSTLSTIVVGAGISGLAAAYALAKSGGTVTVIEASHRVGGLIKTVTEEGYTWEKGPNTVSSTAHSLLTLCEELGLAPVESGLVSKNRYIYHNGQLCAAPDNPISLLGTPLLSPKGKLSLFLEGFKPGKRPGKAEGTEEETVASWASRRLGPEVLETLLGPFLSGIYAGDPAQLSIRAILPKLAQWEAEHGSVSMGALKAAFTPKKRAVKKRYKGLQILSLPGGLQALPQALEKAILQAGGTLLLNRSALHLEALPSLNAPRSGQRYQLTLGTGETLQADRIVLATDALTTARLLETLAPQSSKALLSIPYAPMVAVHLGLPQEQIAHPLDGFGCLLPRSAGLPLLGSIWVSSLFANRAPAGHALLSNFIGGATQPEVAQWSDADCVQTVVSNLETILGARQPFSPSYTRVVRWSRAIPQYTLGHLDRVAQIREGLAAQPGIELLGNYLTGVSLNHCIVQACPESQS